MSAALTPTHDRGDAEQASGRSIEAMLLAESAAFKSAGLVTFDGSDSKGHRSMRYYDQPVMLLNSNAHPTALVSATLAHAERAQAFARIFEVSEPLGSDDHLAAGAYTLARMIEEIVELLQVTLKHEAIVKAPPSALSAA